MKHVVCVFGFWFLVIAPFTGARIETSTGIWTKGWNLIAPFTGARIETNIFKGADGKI